MRNVKVKFDGGTVVMLEIKVKKSAIQLLALSSNTIHWPAHAHKKVNIQRTEGARMNKRECCEREGETGGIVNRTWG